MLEIKAKRIAAFKKFKQLGTPLEDKRTSFHSIRFEDVKLKEVSFIRNAAKGAIFTDLQAAVKDNKVAMNYFGKLINADNKFAAFNTAFWSEGNFIYIPKNSDAKVTLKSILTSDADCATRTLIVADEMSKAEIVELSRGAGDFRSEAVEIILKQGARVRYTGMQDVKGAVNLTIRRAMLEKDSSLEWFDVCFGSKLAAVETTSTLAGQGSTSKSYGVFFGKENQHFDIANRAIHEASGTVSEMLTKGALNDSAKCVYHGLIHIKRNASNSNGYQREESLMLSEHAESEPIPKLNIENNDVKCSHGAAVSQVDAGKLFYLQSRGINAEDAESLVVQGFFSPLTSKLVPEAGNIVDKMIKARI
jgi:Fe-S cluster assembly protein SufD